MNISDLLDLFALLMYYILNICELYPNKDKWNIFVKHKKFASITFWNKKVNLGAII